MFIKGPRFSRQVGITPILEPEQMRKLLDSIPVTREAKIARKHGGGVRVEADVKGLRDRAIIAIMAYTFARVSAVVKLKRGDYSLQGKRARLRLLEKGGKEKLVWLHHEAEQYFDAYLEAVHISDVGAPMFQTLNKNHRLTGRGDFTARYAARGQGALCRRGTPGEHLQPHLPGHWDHGIPAEWWLPGGGPRHGKPLRSAHNQAL